MTTIFDKPLNSEVSSNTQAIANKADMIVLPSGTDLLTIKTTGIYQCSAGCVNGAASILHYMIVTGNGTQAEQIAVLQLVGTIYTRYFNTTWSAWQQIATMEKKSGTVAKASCVGTYNGVLFERTANFVKVIVHGFSSLANGSTEICNVPSGFYSSVSGDSYDAVVLSGNDGTGPRIIRFGISTTGKLTAYNYGSALTNHNAEVSAVFIIG